jgi:hypothetical protein
MKILGEIRIKKERQTYVVTLRNFHAKAGSDWADNGKSYEYNDLGGVVTHVGNKGYFSPDATPSRIFLNCEEKPVTLEVATRASKENARDIAKLVQKNINAFNKKYNHG